MGVASRATAKKGRCCATNSQGRADRKAWEPRLGITEYRRQWYYPCMVYVDKGPRCGHRDGQGHMVHQSRDQC